MYVTVAVSDEVGIGQVIVVPETTAVLVGDTVWLGPAEESVPVGSVVDGSLLGVVVGSAGLSRLGLVLGVSNGLALFGPVLVGSALVGSTEEVWAVLFTFGVALSVLAGVGSAYATTGRPKLSTATKKATTKKSASRAAQVHRRDVAHPVIPAKGAQRGFSTSARTM